MEKFLGFSITLAGLVGIMFALRKPIFTVVDMLPDADIKMKRLRYFKPEEFRGYYDKLDPNLLDKLDEFRHRWGKPVMISPANGSIYRTTGSGQHPLGKAVDIMPQGIRNRSDAQKAVALAITVGFTGVGFYPHWKPRPGLHVDTRDNPSSNRGYDVWGGISDGVTQHYVGVQQAIDNTRPV